jgi:hypothetical protein
VWELCHKSTEVCILGFQGWVATRDGRPALQGGCICCVLPFWAHLDPLHCQHSTLPRAVGATNMNGEAQHYRHCARHNRHGDRAPATRRQAVTLWSAACAVVASWVWAAVDELGLTRFVGCGVVVQGLGVLSMASGLGPCSADLVCGGYESPCRLSTQQFTNMLFYRLARRGPRPA